MIPGGSWPASHEPVPVILALGSNLGDRRENLGTGLRLLDRRLRIERVSRVVESAPWGPVPQGPYLNLVLRGVTPLLPLELLEVLQWVERETGREPGPRFGPRTLDVDLIFHGDRTLDEPRLVVPHPRWEERAFVRALIPDVAGDMIDPVSGRRLSSLCAGADLPDSLLEVPPIEWRSGRSGSTGGRTGDRDPVDPGPLFAPRGHR